MASVKLFNKLTGVSKLWGFSPFRYFTTVNASLLLSRRVKVLLENNFSRASQRLSQRQCTEDEGAGTWFAQGELAAVQPRNLLGAQRNRTCPQKGNSIAS